MEEDESDVEDVLQSEADGLVRVCVTSKDEYKHWIITEKIMFQNNNSFFLKVQ